MIATFVKSSAKLDQLPTANKPEFAFIGRSNVGKSSLINMLTSKKELAKTSGNPGKTQTINHFIIDENWYLVDLPGYGFARVSQTTRAEWFDLMKEYLTMRENLLNVFVLVDVRIEPQKSDLEFINFLGEEGVSLSIVFTKSDKITPNKVRQSTELFKTKLLETWEELPPIFITSSETKSGKDDILNYINECRPLFKIV
jgi:GTP-binding protein